MKTILIVENEPSVRADIQNILASAGFDTLVAENGAQGICLAKERALDLAICDVATLDKNRDEVVRALQFERDTRCVPFIFMTERPKRGDDRKGAVGETSNCLAKPFAPEELLDAVMARLSAREGSPEFAKQQMECLRDNIAWSLSHDLNNLLNPIYCATHLLESHPETEVRELSCVVRESAGSLVCLSQNLLRYTDLRLTLFDPDRLHQAREQGKHKPAATHIVERAALQKASDAGRSEDLHLEVENVLLPIPEEMLLKLAHELVGNAFVLSASGEQIEVRVSRKEGGAILSVAGKAKDLSEKVLPKGMTPEADLPDRNQNFVQLGWDICKAIAQVYGARMESCDGSETAVSVFFPTVAIA